MPDTIPFIDIQAQRRRLADSLNDAISRVLNHGKFILGPEVDELEQSLASFSGVKHCVTCANGTDAIVMVLKAAGIGKEDAVFVPAFTFVASAEAVCLVGATPVLCDVHVDTFNLDPASVAAAVPFARTLGLTPRAIIPVDLFGQPADYESLQVVAKEFDLLLFADAAQSFGAELNGRKVGQLSEAATVSFFPSKPLGCFGDGGAILTDDTNLADKLISLRAHGMGAHKYDNIRIGTNSRLDTLQAAILLQKMSIFEDELNRRQQVAERYSEGIRNARLPAVVAGAKSSWAQYTIKVSNRNLVARRAKAAGIPTAIYYPKPIPLQTGYSDMPIAPGGTPNSNHLAQSVISLPMHPYLENAAQATIIGTINDATSY